MDGIQIKCKKCGGENIYKNGIVAGKQRYKCKCCGCNFREGDNRTNPKIAAKKALCILFYAMAKGSYRMLGRILGIHYTQVYRWVRQFGENLPEPEVPGDIAEVEFDELWHFLKQKKRNFGSSKRCLVVRGEPLPGFSAIVILQRSKNCTTR